MKRKDQDLVKRTPVTELTEVIEVSAEPEEVALRTEVIEIERVAEVGIVITVTTVKDALDIAEVDLETENTTEIVTINTDLLAMNQPVAIDLLEKRSQSRNLLMLVNRL
jgi:hypothetical protein